MKPNQQQCRHYYRGQLFLATNSNRINGIEITLTNVTLIHSILVGPFLLHPHPLTMRAAFSFVSEHFEGQLGLQLLL
jgi:hypothetical protein